MTGTGAALCRVVRPGKAFIGKQGLSYAPGISAESAGATGLHLQMVTIPPGARAKAHKHEGHETAIYALAGTSSTRSASARSCPTSRRTCCGSS